MELCLSPATKMFHVEQNCPKIFKNPLESDFSIFRLSKEFNSLRSFFLYRKTQFFSVKLSCFFEYHTSSQVSSDIFHTIPAKAQLLRSHHRTHCHQNIVITLPAKCQANNFRLIITWHYLTWHFRAIYHITHQKTSHI